jgi:hypothetical protein
MGYSLPRPLCLNAKLSRDLVHNVCAVAYATHHFTEILQSQPLRWITAINTALGDNISRMLSWRAIIAAWACERIELLRSLHTFTGQNYRMYCSRLGKILSWKYTVGGRTNENRKKLLESGMNGWMMKCMEGCKFTG